jgi:hypothetical protein
MILENGNRIDVFDNVFSLPTRTKIYEGCASSEFKIGKECLGSLERGSYDYHLNSRFSDERVSQLGVFNDISKNDEIMELIDGLKLKGTYINLTVSSEAYFVHADSCAKTILYYVNPDWRDGMGGETVFWKDDLSEILFSSPYISGRLIIFDGHVPHSLRPQTVLGPKYRFSMAMMMDR